MGHTEGDDTRTPTGTTAPQRPHCEQGPWPLGVRPGGARLRHPPRRATGPGGGLVVCFAGRCQEFNERLLLFWSRLPQGRRGCTPHLCSPPAIG